MRHTYVSLFSSAGVGDYGFYLSGFNLIASNELIKRRMNIQLANNIANDKSVYIVGDITKRSTKDKIYKEINRKLVKSNNSVDLLVSTPPCQGISVANHFKKGSDLKRNSLVLQSILVSEEIHPKIIVFENVKRFMKTACTDIDGTTTTIRNVINRHLSSNYNIYYKEINFKDYGANSSRPRTLVICTSNEFFGSNFNPKSLMPNKQTPKTLKEVLKNKNLPKLPHLTKMGEIDPNDILHEFKPYRKDMRKWIHDLKPGQNAFENTIPELRPHHRTSDGKIVPNKQKNGDKYRRQEWNKVAPAVHTRNDILASQNTVHPEDDRVFSIRELMRMMNIPNSFRWSKESPQYLNNLPLNKKKQWLKDHEMVIRQSIGEAVPPIIFKQIGTKAKKVLDNYERRQNKTNYTQTSLKQVL